MIEKLLGLLTRRELPQTPLPEADAQHALGALLVRVAMADKAYLFEEIEQIDRILAQAYDLNAVEAAKMRARCEKLAFAVETDAQMVSLIRDAVDYEHRLEKVEALWRVVLADGITDERETALVELVETQLGVARADSDAARASAVIP